MSSKGMINMLQKDVDVKAQKLAQLKRTSQVIETTMAIVQNAEMRGMNAPEFMASIDWLNGVKLAVDAEVALLEPKQPVPPADHTANNSVEGIDSPVFETEDKKLEAVN